MLSVPSIICAHSSILFWIYGKVLGGRNTEKGDTWESLQTLLPSVKSRNNIMALWHTKCTDVLKNQKYLKWQMDNQIDFGWRFVFWKLIAVDALSEPRNRSSFVLFIEIWNFAEICRKFAKNRPQKGTLHFLQINMVRKLQREFLQKAAANGLVHTTGASGTSSRTSTRSTSLREHTRAPLQLHG